MKKLILMGRTGAGKTTLTQALCGKTVAYDKTQYVKVTDNYIDTPGEYTETKFYGGALAVYAYDSDAVGLVQSATEPFSLFPPCCAATANRPVIGIITKINSPHACVDLARIWLENAGCETIFAVDSVNNTGVLKILEYLND